MACKQRLQRRPNSEKFRFSGQVNSQNNARSESELRFLGVLGLVTSTPELNSKPDASPRNLEISKQVVCFNSGKLLQYSVVVLIAPPLEH